MANRYDNDTSMSKSILDENIILRGIVSETIVVLYSYVGYSFICVNFLVKS